MTEGSSRGAEDLVALAKEARKKAYAPYSHFAVGAALLAESGQVYAGCNVENASYGLSVCAERVALFKAVSAGEQRFKAIAVVTETMATSCGSCRQVLAEFGGDELQVIIAAPEGQMEIYTLGELLPASFTSKDLPPFG
ncbi:MAG: cytidine deaminase [Anaerolineae bacterium]